MCRCLYLCCTMAFQGRRSVPGISCIDGLGRPSYVVSGHLCINARAMWRTNVLGCLAAWLLFSGAVAAQTEVAVEAYVGRPLGVARVTLPSGFVDENLPASTYLLVGDEGRALYLAFGGAGGGRPLDALLEKGGRQGGQASASRRRGGGLLRRLRDSGILRDLLPPSYGARTVYFLFRGDQPFRATLQAPAAISFLVTPKNAAPQQYNRLLQAWFASYTTEARQYIEQDNFPPLLETYLPNMLASRFALPAFDASIKTASIKTEPKTRSSQRTQQRSPANNAAAPANVDPNAVQAETLELLFGAEKLRLATMRQAFTNLDGRRQTADLPVPAGIDWPQTPPPMAPGAAAIKEGRDDHIAIEPIARHVPQECFYVRFGTFQNYLWLDGLKKEYDGALAAMVTLRGNNPHLNDRMQRQLAVRQSALAEIFGGQAIADVAFIGRDFYLREGGAVGLLFQSRNDLLFQADFQKQRAQALQEAKENGATSVTVRIAGRDVAFLSTPDNSLRSYWAIDRKFHLITTSKEMVRRFYEVGAETGGHAGSLAMLDEFVRARKLMPLARKDTLFTYFSTPFMQALLAPAYQIELRRRLQAATDIELVELARLAAQAEQAPAETLDDLERGGFLPPHFQTRPDGGHPVMQHNRVVDSIRGAAGGFLPITDTPLTAITAHEAEQAARRAELFLQQWKRLDPLVVGVKRYQLNDQGLERVVIDGHVSLLAEEKYGRYVAMLGPLTNTRVAMAADDIISVQASLQPALRGDPPHHFFAALKDANVLPLSTQLPQGFFQWLPLARSTPGYLGSWPNAGYLDLLPATPDAAGFSQHLLGLWRRQWNDFSVISFDRGILEALPSQIRVTEDEAAAQVRFHVDDLSRAKIQPWLNSLLFQRALESSRGNAAFLNRLSAQFQLPREKALDVANHLLNTQLICALEGKFEVKQHAAGAKFWTSHAWPGAQSRYQAPLWQWFRGAQGYVSKYEGQIFIHAELDIQRKSEEQKGLELPFFDLFRHKPPSLPQPNQPPEVIDTPPARRDIR